MDVEVCVVPHDGDRDLDAVSSAPGVATIWYTTPSHDYPSVFDYYVVVRTGESSFVIPEEGAGRITCNALRPLAT